MTPSNLEKPASISLIHKLHRKGLLGDKALKEAQNLLQPESMWFLWARRNLLILGVILTLCGIVFFFSSSWDKMGRFFQLGLIQTCLVGTAVFSRIYHKKELLSQLLLISACVLTGLLLGVYGYIYQTGADAFEFFLGWALLILGWVGISRFASLWVLFLGILNAAALCYWDQVGAPNNLFPYEWFCIGLGCLNGLALFLKEVGAVRGVLWLNQAWLRILLLAAFLFTLTSPSMEAIVDLERHSDSILLIPIAWLMGAAACFIFYRYKQKDMLCLAMVVLNACIILLTIVGRVLFHDDSGVEEWMMLVFSLIILLVVSGAGLWLKNMAKEQNP